MTNERTLEEVLQQYLAENDMYRTEGPKGVNNLEKLVTALGYDSNYSVSVLHAFLEDNAGCIEAMIEWIGTRNVPEWKASIESQLQDTNPEDDDGDTSDGEDQKVSENISA